MTRIFIIREMVMLLMRFYSWPLAHLSMKLLGTLWVRNVHEVKYYVSFPFIFLYDVQTCPKVLLLFVPWTIYILSRYSTAQKGHKTKNYNRYLVSIMLCWMIFSNQLPDFHREKSSDNRVHRVVMATFWCRFHHYGKIIPEAEFLDVIGTKD